MGFSLRLHPRISWFNVNPERLLDNLLQIAEYGTPVLSADHDSAHISLFSAAMSARNRASARAVLHISIVGPATALNPKPLNPKPLNP